MAPALPSEAPLPSGGHQEGVHGPGEESEPRPVSQQELNAWRRGFTPQAEIWNGRLAMLGLSAGLTVLIVARLVHRG